jgi:hypothetical protein
MPVPKLVSAELRSGFVLSLTFSDNFRADVDFSDELVGGVFDQLHDPRYFASFKFRPQFGTIEWDNGADFSPECLYELARRNGHKAEDSEELAQRKSA